MTPRKTSTRRLATTHRTPLSYTQPAPAEYSPPEPLLRTNTTLNLSVLRRHVPSITEILAIAANAVLYAFTPAPAPAWEKSGIEGTLFVCACSDNTTRVVVLNRRGLDNFVVNLKGVRDVELTVELTILRFEDGPGDTEKVVGLWIHEDKEGAREEVVQTIQSCWKECWAEERVEVRGDELPAHEQAGVDEQLALGAQVHPREWSQQEIQSGMSEEQRQYMLHMRQMEENQHGMGQMQQFMEPPVQQYPRHLQQPQPPHQLPPHQLPRQSQPPPPPQQADILMSLFSQARAAL